MGRVADGRKSLSWLSMWRTAYVEGRTCSQGLDAVAVACPAVVR